MAPKNLLIIDDDLSIRKSLSNFFEDRGYNIFPAEDGHQGLEIFFKQKIDLVITDLRMPKTDGIDVMKSIHEKNPEVPMVVVSGAGTEEDIIKALRMGAKDYITKPITDFEVIEHTVEKVLEISQLNRENKAYRKRLEKSEKQYRTITENIAEGVFTIDANLNVTYTNQAFCKMLDFENSEIIGKKLSDFALKTGVLDFFKERLPEQLKKQGIFRNDIQLVGQNSHIVHAELSCSALLDDDDLYQGMIIIARDITAMVTLRDKYKKFLTSTPDAKKDVIPICASCKNIKIRKGEWIKIEDYFSTITFSHGICPECCSKLYPDFDISRTSS